MCTGDACRCRCVDANNDLAYVGGSSVLAQAYRRHTTEFPSRSQQHRRAVVRIDLASQEHHSDIRKCGQSRVPVGIASTVAFEREGSGPYALRHDPATCPSQGPSAERNYMPSGG